MTVDEVVDEGEQEPQDSLLDDLLDIAEVDVHEEDQEQEENKDDDEEEYDPEEDKYLCNFINKDSQVGIALGGQPCQPGPNGSKFVSLVSLFTGA